MKKRNHPANVVDVSSRIMGLLGRRKVDPTTEAMRELKPNFVATNVDFATMAEPFDVVVIGAGRQAFLRPDFDLSQWKQLHGRIERQPGLTPDEQQRLIDVLEKHLT